MGDATFFDSRYLTRLSFRGQLVRVLQARRRRQTAEEVAADGTGWRVWNASKVLCRYVEDDGVVEDLLRQRPDVPPPPSSAFADLTVCDLSAGAGLITLACAFGEAAVVATDIPFQLPLVVENLAANAPSIRDRVEPVELFWGNDVAPALAAAGRVRARLGRSTGAATTTSTASSSSISSSSGGVSTSSAAPLPAPSFDITFASDLVYIGIRDGVQEELRRALGLFALHSRALLLGYEERISWETEHAFIASLSNAVYTAAGPTGETLLDCTLQKKDGEAAGCGAAPAVPAVGGAAAAPVAGGADAVSAGSASAAAAAPAPIVFRLVVRELTGAPVELGPDEVLTRCDVRRRRPAPVVDEAAGGGAAAPAPAATAAPAAAAGAAGAATIDEYEEVPASERGEEEDADTAELHDAVSRMFWFPPPIRAFVIHAVPA